MLDGVSVVLRRNIGLLGVVTALVMGASTVLAHHSIVAVYDFSQRLTLDGAVVEFEFINPHPFLTIDVKGRGSRSERWRLEMDNRWELAELGFANETLKPGDRLVVLANPARSQSRSGYIRRLERPSDGFKYQHHD